MTNASEVTDKLYFEMTLVFWSKCCNFAILTVVDVHLPLFIVKCYCIMLFKGYLKASLQKIMPFFKAK